MKKTVLSRGWILQRGNKNEDIIVPNDYMLGAGQSRDSITGADQGFFMAGCAKYEFKFTAEEGKHHAFLFDGVMGLCEVFLNGNMIGRHNWGYTSFICEADSFIEKGENTLTVCVDNTPQPSSRWYTGAGIFREALLLTSDSDYITPYGLCVKTLSADDGHAYIDVEVEINADSAGCADVCVDISGDEGILKSVVRHIWLEKGINTVPIKVYLDGTKLWFPDSPVVYSAKASLTKGESSDTAETAFGIRTVECDPSRGFLLNGTPIKLLGACVHHDNGIVGAASFRSAEERRVRILKENGFNAIRTSHNPPSSVFLDVCDKMGMLVIDEMFDAWIVGKRSFDYHLQFEDNFRRDVSVTVKRDRNHPSVVMWSTGNEISEKRGVSNGYRSNNRIIEVIRELDKTRPITHALCDFWDNWEASQKDVATRGLPPEQLDYFSEKTQPVADMLDVVGYNYFMYRLDKDMISFPERIVAMTESFPKDAVIVGKALDKYPRFIGEFVWTGWDYFGETGIGHTSEGDAGTWGLTEYPEHTANCGDFDICGFKTPQSYYRDASFKPGCVRIMTADPAEYGKKYTLSAWGFYRVERTWNYSSEVGSRTTVQVYTVCDECELWLNGGSLGRKAPDVNGIAEFEVQYFPGRLEAVGYINGVKASEDILETAGKPASIKIIPDLTGKSGDTDIIYAEVHVLDGEGREVPNASCEITVSADGGKVVGTGNGCGKVIHDYLSNVCPVYNGHMLAAIAPDENADALIIKAAADNGFNAEYTFTL